MDRISRIATQFFNLTMRMVGILTKDKDREDVRAGDFIDALNTRSITDEGQTTDARQNIRGNTYVFKPEAIALQNKKFRIYVRSDANGTYGVSFFDGNSNLIGNFASVVVSLNNIAQTLQDFAYTGANSIQTVLTAASQTFNLNTVITGTTEGYVEVEITTVPYWNYGCESTTLFLITLTATVVTSQESYDQTLIGDWNLIGSWDLQGELILWWTTQRNLPLELDINNITNNGSGRFRIQTTVAHGLVSNEKVVVAGVEAGLPTTIINGQWIVTGVSATEFDLNGSVWGAIISSADATVTADPQGIGELGRAVKDENTQTWSYVRLIRAKALNWVTKHQMDTLCKKDALRKYYRYTDDYNPIGNLYDRTLVYQNDCLLSFVDPRNTYTYENIGQESQFIQNGADFSFEFTTQDQSGGAILSGNSRFAVRLFTDTLVPTTWSPLTNPVPAAVISELDNPVYWSGDAANVVTTKINNFLLEGTGLSDNYKWAQIGVINYQGDAIVGLLLPRVLITSDSQTLRWTGNEATEDLDVGTVQEITFGYKTALSIDELDGRIILSNLTSSTSYDLSGFAQSLTHSLLQKELPAIGSRYTGSLIVGEYELSQNVNNWVGYELNETYRFGLQAEFWDGGESLVYFIQDIKFDTDATYPRRVAALPNYNITNAAGTIVYVPYIQFSGIDWNYILPSGQRLKDVVRKLRIVRVERDDTNREVISGIAVLGSNGNQPEAAVIPSAAVPTYNGTAIMGYAGADNQGEFMWAEGMDFGVGVPNKSYPEFGGTRAGFAALYCPDIMYGQTTWDLSTDDKIIDYDNPSMLFTPSQTGHTPSDNAFWNNMVEFAGDGINPPPPKTITNAVNIGFGTTGTIAGSTFSKIYTLNFQDIFPPYVADITGSFPTSPVITCVFSVGGFVTSNRGVKRIQIYMPKTDKFGDSTLSKYVSTGATLDDTSATTIDVFGGDVYTQKTWIRHRITTAFSQPAGVQFTVSGYGGGFGFYAQNKVNTQDTDRVNSVDEYQYPWVTEGEWLNTLRTTNPEPTYNSGYTLRNQVQSYAAYNPDQSLVASDFPVRLIYGQKTQPEQASDMQRVFLPLDFTDLQYKDGEIVNHRVVNSELCSWQDGYFSRLYFRSNRLITTNSGAEVITGTGDAFTNRPLNITSYGCSNKWAILIGRSAGGNDVAYWINDRLKSFIRFGGDGTTNQGVIHGIDSFLRYNLNMAVGKRTPADGEGICSTWNEAFKEAIFTVRAWRSGVSAWDSNTKYNIGDIVSHGTLGFEEFPQFYVSLVNNNFNSQPPSANWQTIAITNPLFYNIYTLVFNELRNGFDGFVSFKPKIYATVANTILSPRPISNVGEMYEHGRGNWCWFYDNGTTKQAEDGKTRVVFNADPSAAKEYLALIMWTQETPYHMNLKTAEHESYLDAVDFEAREGKFYAAIQADSTVTTVPSAFGSEANPLGINTADTTCPIYGNYLEIELVFENGVKQIWSSCVIKGQLRDRLNKT